MNTLTHLVITLVVSLVRHHALTTEAARAIVRLVYTGSWG